MGEINSNIIFATKDLSIGYSKKKQKTVIASQINIGLQEGELIGLVGANGIGKSTLLRTLTKVQPQLEGDIFLNGALLSEFSSMELARSLSIVLTESIVSKNLTVRELVALGASALHQLDR